MDEPELLVEGFHPYKIFQLQNPAKFFCSVEEVISVLSDHVNLVKVTSGMD